VSEERYLTARQVAQEFGEFFSETRLRSWRWRRVGPHFVRVGKRCLYRRSDLLEWLNSNVRAAAGDESSMGGVKR
jgi:hypothetical protein